MRVFDEDRQLGRYLDDATLGKARRQIVVDSYILARSAPLPDELLTLEGPPPVGCLILDGFISQTVDLAGRRGLAVLGPGDVLCPWHAQGADASVPHSERWSAMSLARLALLDGHFESICGRLPGVTGELMERAARSARSLALHRALSQLPSLRRRLLVLLWYFADRWGKVTSDGVVLPLKLPHDTLAELVGARRPSVTIALNELSQEGRVSRQARALWHLHGEPPLGVGDRAPAAPCLDVPLA